MGDHLDSRTLLAAAAGDHHAPRVEQNRLVFWRVCLVIHGFAEAGELRLLHTKPQAPPLLI